MLRVAVTLLLLHAADGTIVTVNPEQITSMREGRDGASGKHFAGNVRCMVNTSDGKFVTVIEECETVRSMIK